jgi:hypothetical protein
MDIKKYTCNICNKNYKTPQSLWNHKNKFHTEITYNNSILTPPNLFSTQNNLILTQQNDINNLTCNYCKIQYSRIDNLNRHIKKCKHKDLIIKNYEELKQKNQENEQQILEMKKTFDEMKSILLDMMNKQYKMHPKKLQKLINGTNNGIINNNNNSNNNSNSNNSNSNNIIVNNLNIIELGYEELNKVFTEEEKLKILRRGYSSLEEIIRHTHLNNDYLQFQSIIITNKRSNEGYQTIG